MKRINHLFLFVGSSHTKSIIPSFVLLCLIVLFFNSAMAQKVYIITDLEGASGVYKWSQIDNKDDDLNKEACEYYMKDLEAVIKGFKDGGAKEIFVFDAHGLQIIIPHLMTPGVKYLTGHPRPEGLLGLDSTYDAVALVGFHAMEGTENGVLNHTQNPYNHARYWYNGIESGEIAQDALKCGFFGVPVVLVSGDDATCREATKFLGKDVVTVAVKEGIAEQSAVLYALPDTYKALYEGAKKAMSVIKKCKPYVLQMPIKAKKTYYSTEGADPRFPIPVLKTSEWVINSEPELKEY
jgi:D-amino peptidase